MKRSETMTQILVYHLQGQTSAIYVGESECWTADEVISRLIQLNATWRLF